MQVYSAKMQSKVNYLRRKYKDSNDKYWYLGYDDYVSSTAGGGTTGTNKGDGNNYTLTLTDQSETYPYEITEDAVDAVVEK